MWILLLFVNVSGANSDFSGTVQEEDLDQYASSLRADVGNRYSRVAAMAIYLERYRRSKLKTGDLNDEGSALNRFSEAIKAVPVLKAKRKLMYKGQPKDAVVKYGGPDNYILINEPAFEAISVRRQYQFIDHEFSRFIPGHEDNDEGDLSSSVEDYPSALPPFFICQFIFVGSGRGSQASRAVLNDALVPISTLEVEAESFNASRLKPFRIPLADENGRSTGDGFNVLISQFEDGFSVPINNSRFVPTAYAQRILFQTFISEPATMGRKRKEKSLNSETGKISLSDLRYGSLFSHSSRAEVLGLARTYGSSRFVEKIGAAVHLQCER